MIFSCEKNTLLNGINIASKALPVRSVNPICDGILIEAKNNAVALTTTDSALTIQTKIAAQIEEEGEIVINGKFFFEVIRRMPEGELKIKGSFRDGVEINGINSKMNISAMNPDEYPELPVISRDSFFAIEQGTLKKMINQTMFATAVDESRPVLTGCLFEVEEKNINIVALDGYRLALRSMDVEDTDKTFRAVIPARALSEVTKIMSDSDDLVRLYVERTYCLFELEETRITTRLIEGDFIRYKPIIPTNLTSHITVDRLDLLDAVDRAWLIARENTRNNYVVFRFKDDYVEITARSETGNAYEEVKFAGNAAPMEIGFNPKFFVDCLKNIEEEFITINFTNNASPVVIKPVEGEQYLYLILPIRL